MKNAVVKFLRDEKGATAIEYGLIAGLVSIAIIAAMTTISGELKRLFELVADGLAGAGVAAGE